MKIGDYNLRKDEEEFVTSWLTSWIANGSYKLRAQLNKPFSEYEFTEFLAKECEKRKTPQKPRRTPDPKVADNSNVARQKEDKKEDKKSDSKKDKKENDSNKAKDTKN